MRPSTASPGRRPAMAARSAMGTKSAWLAGSTAAASRGMAQPGASVSTRVALHVPGAHEVEASRPHQRGGADTRKGGRRRLEPRIEAAAGIATAPRQQHRRDRRGRLVRGGGRLQRTGRRGRQRCRRPRRAPDPARPGPPAGGRPPGSPPSPRRPAGRRPGPTPTITASLVSTDSADRSSEVTARSSRPAFPRNRCSSCRARAPRRGRAAREASGCGSTGRGSCRSSTHSSRPRSLL